MRLILAVRKEQTAQKAKCVVYLEDENGRQRHVEVEDEWLTANGIEEGSSWKENITDEA